MATQNTFVIEYGLSVGSTEVITSAGKIVASAFVSFGIANCLNVGTDFNGDISEPINVEGNPY